MCKFKKFIAAWTAAVIFSCGLIIPETASSLTIKEEEELSVEFLKAVFEAYDIIKDPVINDYINEVGQKIISAMPPQPLAYKFYAVRQDAYNAFAGPGGNIFIFSGLFCALESEDELAALLAHEIAHVSCRHISEMMKKSKKTNMATMAGVVAGILIGLGGAGTVGTALTIGSMAAGQSIALAYSRENEMQADQIGRTYLQKAGYNLNGLLSILKKIRSVDWFDAEQIPTYLKTHPATEERIMYLDNLLENREAPPAKKNYAFERAHTRIVALYGDPDTALRLFKGLVEENPDNFMAQYGYGLILNREGNPKAAVDHLIIALQKNPTDPGFKIDLGKAYFMAGEYLNALKILEKTSKSAIGTTIGHIYLGRSLMALGRYEEAADTFNTLIKDDPDNVDAYFFLGETYGKLNQLTSAHYNLGQYYLKNRNLQTARFHLNKALEYEKNPEQIEKIKQLLKDLDPPTNFFGIDKEKETDKK
ncbi:MAG: M48 family metalloprotease [Desulfobacteraceae bacterium]|nr:M48 family metalloprotease [Desulfobacteraceae bacterium]MBC2755555.1 M48 family metalloprotease [Desulfobacteraceae bacterium]